MAHPPEDPSGIMVYPKMPVPQRTSEPKVKGFSSTGGSGPSRARLAAVLGGAFVLGGGVGFVARPTHGGEADVAKKQLAEQKKALDAATTKAKDLEAAQTKLTADKADEDKKLEELQGKAADLDKKAAELAEEEKKVQGAVDKASGSVSTEGDEIHLQLVDKVLFPTGEDKLTEKGKQVLQKVAVALKALPDKQIWVQGHTDDQPIYLRPKKEPPKKGKGAKLEKEAEEKVPEELRYFTNWELSAGRALEVVHYLQDVAKIEPTRLAALAFGQYRPVSRTNKAANRRIEIVLYPKKAILKKEK
ncbi:MAG: OmpA family protein [Acidobacteriota bacterium]